MDVPDDNPYVRDPPRSFEPADNLDPAAAEQQIEHLREAIRYHDHRYYERADPVISDRAYDTLFDRLLELEETFDFRSETSPTRRVGGRPIDELDTVEHVAPLR